MHVTCCASYPIYAPATRRAACCMLHVACCMLRIGVCGRIACNTCSVLLQCASLLGPRGGRARQPRVCYMTWSTWRATLHAVCHAAHCASRHVARRRPPTEREGGARARSRRSRLRAVVRAAAARLRCARRPHVQRVRLTSCTTAAAARRTARRATRGTARTGHRCRETVGARGTAPRTTLWLGVMLLPWRCLARAPPGGMFLLACHVACANGGMANAMITSWTAARCSLRACARALGAAIP